MRQREAMQVEIVGLGILRPRAGIEESAGHAQRRQQSLPYLRGHLRLQCDQIVERAQ